MKKTVAFLTFLVAATLALHAAKPNPQEFADIALSCVDCNQTTPLTISGTGWGRRVRVEITVTGDGSANYFVETDRRGSFAAIFPTASYPVGSYTVNASLGTASVTEPFTIN